MKVALCISGESRYSMVSFPFLYDSFKNTSNEIKLDVFYHSWNCDNRVIDLWKPKKVIIESEESAYQKILSEIKIQIDYNKEHTDNRVLNNLLMFYAIHKIISEVDENEYDFIIRIRPDLFLYQKINLFKILNDIKLNKYNIWIPNSTFNYSEVGYNDQFAIGNFNSMKIYSSVYKNLSKYIENNSRWFPEEFLYAHLTENNINVYQEDIYYQLIRNVNIVTNHKNIPPFKLY